MTQKEYKDEKNMPGKLYLNNSQQSEIKNFQTTVFIFKFNLLFFYSGTINVVLH